MTTPAHLYPLCENCGATVFPPVAGFLCEHVCGASRVAPEAREGALSGSFSRRVRLDFCSTHSIRARASSTTRSVAKLSWIHVSRVSSSSLSMPHMSTENHVNASTARG